MMQHWPDSLNFLLPDTILSSVRKKWRAHALCSDAHLISLYVAILKRGGTVTGQRHIHNGDIVIEVRIPGSEIIEAFWLSTQ